MQELIYIIQALNVFYRSAHWRSKGDFFYQNHLLFQRLYEGLDDEIDTLVELIIGDTSDTAFVAPKLFNDKTQSYTPIGSEDAQLNLTRGAELEKLLLSKIQALNENSISVGIFNHIAGIAQNHSRNLYLIEQTLRKQ